MMTHQGDILTLLLLYAEMMLSKKRAKRLWARRPQLSFTQTRCVYISQSPAGVLQPPTPNPRLPARRLLLSFFFFFFNAVTSQTKKKKKKGVVSELVSQVRTITSDVTKGRRENKGARGRESERVRRSGRKVTGNVAGQRWGASKSLPSLADRPSA